MIERYQIIKIKPTDKEYLISSFLIRETSFNFEFWMTGKDITPTQEYRFQLLDFRSDDRYSGILLPVYNISRDEYYSEKLRKNVCDILLNTEIYEAVIELYNNKSERIDNDKIFKSEITLRREKIDIIRNRLS
jgi:hypothetical protein